MAHRQPDIARITLVVLFIGALIAASFGIMRPFLPAIIWAVTLTVATWPLLLWVERKAGGRRWLAVLILTATLLLTVFIPSWLAISTVIANLDEIADLGRSVLSMRVPTAPDWLVSLPLVGARIGEGWSKVASIRLEEFVPRLQPFAGTLAQWFAAAVGGLGSIMLHFVLTTAIAAIMYAKGEAAAAAAIRFGGRLGGDRGQMAIRLAGQAIRSVALGVVITALAQCAIAGAGLIVVGMPFAAVLTALIFVLCLIQLGPALVLIPSIVWMYYTGNTVWATVLLAFSVLATTIDQFVRPALIRRGADLPILLILAGVIGGLMAFGVLGIFIGPTVLAVAYTLLKAWVEEGISADELSTDGAPGSPMVADIAAGQRDLTAGS